MARLELSGVGWGGMVCLSPHWEPEGGDARVWAEVMMFGSILRAVFQITPSVICMCEGNHLQQIHGL